MEEERLRGRIADTEGIIRVFPEPSPACGSGLIIRACDRGQDHQRVIEGGGIIGPSRFHQESTVLFPGIPCMG
ncbi:hypothetical protein ASZ90_015993 [hydrocarbon metagenome]|uniref:Uncharacterized protein n=1 Tax=hydrocarbon metagenome TaxID=938273 RepID=A0A0W8F0J1_9ZZZZ